ncbi:MAG: polysaccharide biosynthesis/export family protein [Thermodesulfobacteriota bacterium]
MRPRHCITALCLLAALFCLRVAALAAEVEYTIGLGDVIDVQVWKEPDISRQLRVRLDGRISLPLAGDVQTAGKTPAGLATELQDKLKTYIAEPSVTVILLESTSRRYYVIGQIQKPGEFPMDAPITALQAVARAGGFQEWAKTARILIVRRQNGKEETIPFDYEAYTKGGGGGNPVIAAGDTIIVP